MNKIFTPQVQQYLKHVLYAVLGGAVSVLAYLATQHFSGINYSDVTTAFLVGAGLIQAPNLKAVQAAQVKKGGVAPETGGNPPVPHADGLNAAEFPAAGK